MNKRNLNYFLNNKNIATSIDSQPLSGQEAFQIPHLSVVRELSNSIAQTIDGRISSVAVLPRDFLGVDGKASGQIVFKYDSEDHVIYLGYGLSGEAFEKGKCIQVDCNDFIIDGMLLSVGTDMSIPENPKLIFYWNTQSGKEPVTICVKDILGGVYSGANYISVDNSFKISLNKNELLADMGYGTVQSYISYLSGTNGTNGAVGQMSSDISSLFSSRAKDLKFIGHIRGVEQLSSKTISQFFGELFPDMPYVQNGSFMPVDFEGHAELSDCVHTAGAENVLSVGNGDVVIFHDHGDNALINVNDLSVGKNVFVLKAGVSRYEYEKNSADTSMISNWIDDNFGGFPATGGGVDTTVAKKNVKVSSDLSAKNIFVNQISAENLSIETVTLSAADNDDISVITQIGETRGILNLSAQTLDERNVHGLCADLTNLCVGLNNKVYIKNEIDGVVGYENLSVVKITKDDFESIQNYNPRTIYIVSSDYIDAYGQQVKNLSDATDSQDAVTKSQLDDISSEFNSRCEGLSGWLNSNFTSEAALSVKKTLVGGIVSAQMLEAVNINEQLSNLSDMVNEKVWFKTLANGETVSGYSDLSVVKIDKNQYDQLVWTNQISSLSNVIFEVSSDVVDAYGQKVVNVLSGTNDGDAVNYGQVKHMIGNRLSGFLIDGRPLNRADFQGTTFENIGRMLEFIFDKFGGL